LEDPRPDHGEESYRGCGRLEGKATIITGADSGIDKAVAIAFAREGADVLISYLHEHEDAQEAQRWVEEAGRKGVLVSGDLPDPAHCRAVVSKTVEEFGRVDVLVSNAAFQMTRESPQEIPTRSVITLAIGLGSRPRWPRSTSCWPPMRPATSRRPHRGHGRQAHPVATPSVDRPA